MKANIHPETKEITVKCACGETFTTKSNSDKNVEVCHKCHPAYGLGANTKTKKVSSNIEKFNNKYNLNK